jgi:uncharacterized protein
MVQNALVLLLGIIIGTFSGMVGIGGGILAIPAMMLLLGFTQAQANGTTLAMMLPPIGLFAVLNYARAGNVDWRIAMLMAVGFAVGAYGGSLIITNQWISPTALRVSFALLLLYVAGRMLFRPGGRAMAALETSLLVVGFALTYTFMRMLGNHWAGSHSHWGRHYRARQRNPHVDDYEI